MRCPCRSFQEEEAAMDRTDRILEIAYGTMSPEQLIDLGATMDDVDGAKDLLLMDQELERAVAPVAMPHPLQFINDVLRHLRDQRG